MDDGKGMRAMRLADLLQALPEKRVQGDAGLEITGIAYDSRRLESGQLFVAVPGFHVDGHVFVAEAVAKGAAAVVLEERRGSIPDGVTAIVVPDSRRALADLAAAFYGYPGRKLRVVGVTGTDGKTTTTYLISALLEKAGYSTGLLGTVDFKVGARSWANLSRQTTPEALEVQAMLAEMVGAGVDYAIVESTSHGLALHRVTNCEYDVGVFTNLTSDHLDFHGSREEYLAAKAKLFSLLGTAYPKGIEKTAVLNRDDAIYDVLRQISPSRVISYGLGEEADVRAADIVLTDRGATFTVQTPHGNSRIASRLPALFNVYNALAAIAVGLSQGLDLDTARTTLEDVTGVPGRMERIDLGQPFTFIVDYAHTPDSLEKVLRTLRPLTEGRLVVIFGCAGERDRARRTGMGQVAGRLADFAVLTNEDPRHEDPQAILEEIASGLRAAERRDGADFVMVEDRREAVEHACRLAKPGDLLLLAGKGHEQSIIVGDRKLPWDDRQAAREVLAAMGYAQAERSPSD